MEFNPTNDYYGMDPSKESNMVLWNFWEFVKNLVTLSSPSDKQVEVIGYGAVCDEMAMDFGTYYTNPKQSYIDNHLLTSDQTKTLDELDQYFENQSGDKNPDFWDDLKLKSSPDWDIVRDKAKDVLIKLGFDDLEIEIERKEEVEGNSNLITQYTRTKLIKRNAS